MLAGFSLAEADVLRKAVGKKDADLIKKELGKFCERAMALGHPKKMVDEWNRIVRGYLRAAEWLSKDENREEAFRMLREKTGLTPAGILAAPRASGVMRMTTFGAK